MIFYYTNSFLASVVSILGCAFAMIGIAFMTEGEILGGIIMIVVAVPFLAGGKWISNNKAFKKWWKQITDKNLEPEIARSAETAMAIYQKNPQKRTLEAIRKLNPAAAAWIEGGGKGPAPQGKQTPAPQPKAVQQPQPAPASQPKPVQQPRPAADVASPETAIAQARKMAEANTGRKADVYWECAMKLETFYASYPNHVQLQQELAQYYTSYASALQDPSFDARKKAVEVLLRALDVDKQADTARKDNRILWLYVHALNASGDAENRQQLEKSRELLRHISAYRIQNPNDKTRKLMDVSLPVAQCRINSHLAKSLSTEYPQDLKKALALAEEALRLCPLDLMRVSDLNPYKEGNSAVILTRQSIANLKNQIVSKMNG